MLALVIVATPLLEMDLLVKMLTNVQLELTNVKIQPFV